jgi:NADH pyrophosphatase NudC (nudix superfamily)
MKFCPQCATALEQRIVHGLERMVCPVADCGFVAWDNPLPVVAALVERGGEVVLARNARWPAGVFSMITGFLERGETPEEAVLRETREELGLDGLEARFIGYYPYLRRNQLILAFCVSARGDVVPGEEIAEVRLVSRRELGAYDFGRLALTQVVVRDWLAMPAHMR